MKRKQQKRVLVLDVASASVGAGVSHTKNGSVVLEKVSRIPISAGSKEARDALEKRMLSALAELVKNYSGEYEEVRVIVAAPWHHGQIRTIHSKTDRPESISIHSIEQIVEQYKNEAPPKDGNVDVEAVAVQVQVNNYPTSLARPVSGTRVRINLYESEMPSALQRSILKTLEADVSWKRIAFNTFPLVSGAAIRAMTLETSFVFIDVGGEVTELGVMHQDGIHFLGSIPIGYWTVIREMGGEKVGDARSRLTLLSKGELSSEEAASTAELFAKAFEPWNTEFENMLKEASTLVPVPRSVFLLSDTEPREWFKQGIEQYGSMNLSPQLITSSTVQRFVEVGEGGSFDVFLSLAAIFFHIGELEVVGEPVPRKMVYSK